MTMPQGESIQESLDRLNKAQSKRTVKDAGPAHSQLARDQDWQLHLVVVFVFGLLAAIFGKMIASGAVPDSGPDLIGSTMFGLGCAAMIASTLLTAAWMIVDFPRWRRAASGHVNDDPPTMIDVPPTIPSGDSRRRSRLSWMKFSGFSDGGGGDWGGGDCGGGGDC